MTDTRRYTSLHTAFAAAAAKRGVEPFIARVALALFERGDTATTQQIASDLQVDGSTVRRALLLMYDRGLAEGKGVDGGPRRQGVATEVTLTSTGRWLAVAVRDHDRHEFPLEVAA